MVSKIYLTEEEFDRENFNIQRQYRYCKTCGLFFHVESIGERCGHPHGYFTVQSERDRLTEEDDFIARYNKFRGDL